MNSSVILLSSLFLLSILGYLVTEKTSWLWVGGVSIVVILFFQTTKMGRWLKQKMRKEGFQLGNNGEEEQEKRFKKQEEIEEGEGEENENENEIHQEEEQENDNEKTKKNQFQRIKEREEKKKNIDKRSRKRKNGEVESAEEGEEGFQNLSWSSVTSSMNPLLSSVNSGRPTGGGGEMGMGMGKKIASPEELTTFLDVNYMKTDPKNPFGNVLLTEINDDPSRKSAAPSFNPMVTKKITSSIKEMVQELNPSIENSSKQLFGDLYNNFELDQSNRQFFSNPNTKIPNDQGAFAYFLYGNMPSGKLDPEAMVQDNLRYILY